MCGDDDRAVPRQGGEQVTEPRALLGVQPGRRLVQDQELRLVEQRLRDPDALDHTAGEFSHLFVRRIRQGDEVQQLRDLGLRNGAADPLERRDVAQIGARGVVAVVAELLRQIAHQLAELPVQLPDVLPVPLDDAGRGAQ